MSINLKKRWKLYLVFLLFVFSLIYSFIYPTIIGLYYQIRGTLDYEKEVNISLNESSNLTINLEAPDIPKLREFRITGNVNGSSIVYLKSINSTYIVLNETDAEFNDSCIETCNLDEFNQTSFELIFELNGTINITKISYKVENLSWMEEEKEINESIEKAAKENGTVEVIVILKEPKEFSVKSKGEKEDLEEIREKVDRAQERIEASLNGSEIEIKQKYETINAIVVNVSRDDIKKLKNNPDIERIVLDEVKELFLNDSVQLINADSVHGIQINGINITGLGETVCIIDSGVDYNHSALGSGFGNKIIAGYDFVNNDTDPMDDMGHGTLVAGIIGSTDSKYKGIAPDSKIVAIKVCDAFGCLTSNILAGIDWCINNSQTYNISVISMSLGAGAYSDYCNDVPEATAINSAFSNGIFVSVASGNNNMTNAISEPACVENATSVGATTKNDQIWNGTNRASILDLLAPGVNINSTYMGNTFEMRSGTSAAAPHVSGAALLMKQYAKLVGYSNISPYVIKTLLKRNGKDIYDEASGITFKRIDVLNATLAIIPINESENSLHDENVKIIFNQAVDLSFVPVAFTLRNNFVSLNSTAYPQYNISANITFYNLSYVYTPVILKDGVVCNPPQCNITYYDGNLSFVVSGFTNYTSAPNSELKIFDENDVEGGYLNKTRYENITFFANYSNRTSGLPLTTASCNITFSDENASMTYNPSSGLFEYQKMFFVAGQYEYNVTCNAANFENLSLNDTIMVLPLSECKFPLPNNDWLIVDNESVICNNENILMQNQSIKINGTSKLILNHSNLSLNYSSVLFINVTQNASFIAQDSRLFSTSTAGYDLDCYDNSKIEINDSEISNKLRKIDINDNCEAKFYNSSMFEIYLSFFNTSIIHSNNSLFNESVYFRGNSVSDIENSYIKNAWLQYGAVVNAKNTTINTLNLNSINGTMVPLINFSLPQSKINAIRIFNFNSTMAGYVDMPSSVSLFSTAARVVRYYPVHINYTNGSPVINKSVNITNNSVLLWQGISDSEGIANPILNFTNATMNDIYNVTVNPTQNISLLTDTPIVFTLDIPNITLLIPDNNTFDMDGNVTFIYWVNDTDSLISNCSLYINETLNQTNTTITEEINQSFSIENVSDGVYEWYISCYDDAGNIGISERRILNVDSAPPIINLISPLNNATISTSNVTFYYNVSDEMAGISNCSLMINGAINETNATITESTTQNFSKSLPNGNYNWSIECYDSNGWLGTSEIRNITIASPYCGDGSCNNGETCNSCSIDCGSCSNEGGGGGGGGGGIVILPAKNESEENASESVIETNESFTETNTTKINETEEIIQPEKEEKKPITENPRVVSKLNAGSLLNMIKENVGELKRLVSDEIGLTGIYILETGLLFLILLMILYYPLLLITKRTYAEDDVIKRLIEEKRINDFKRIYVLPDVFNKYKYVKIDGKKIKNLVVADPTKRDERIVKSLYQEFGLDLEILKLIAMARNRSIFARILTIKELPEELKKRWIRIDFENPFEEEDLKDSGNQGS